MMEAPAVESALTPAGSETILDRAIEQIEDEQLRAKIAREVELLRGARRFGLVFDRHLPESIRLNYYPIRKGIRVTLRDESSEQTWRVVRFTDLTRQTVALDDDSERPAAHLVAVREFGEPVCPGLRSVDRIPDGKPEDPWHVVINGENFHVLQALRSTHRGKVDLIYIDPPYNTGNDGWIYNDRYVDTNDRAKSSKWLSFLERRLDIAKTLMKPTGVLIAAIGDDEHHRLRMLMDQVFGPENFLADVVWIGSTKGDAKFSGGGLDYMLIYARNQDVLAESGATWREPKEGLDELIAAGATVWEEADHDAAAATTLLSRWWLQNKFRFDPGLGDNVKIDDDGSLYKVENLVSPNPRPNLQFDVLHPATGLPVRMNPKGWRYSRDAMDQLIADGRILFGADHNSGIRKKTPLSELTSQNARPTFTRDRRAASRRLEAILGDKRFPYPKDHEVLMRWFRMVAPTNAVVLDFFGGSGSTTEAVMRLNAEDGGTRQSILVTNNEVGPVAARALRREGHHPGDTEWSAKGVFEYVTHPRISTVVRGTRPDGSVYSDGMAANVEFFELRYLDPGMVRRGREFEAIAPLLWLEAGATGQRIDAVPDEGWAIADNYAVLFDIDAAKPYVGAITDRAKSGTTPELAFVITDSVAAFQTIIERLPSGAMPVRLFEDYLTNFTANTDGVAR